MDSAEAPLGSPPAGPPTVQEEAPGKAYVALVHLLGRALLGYADPARRTARLQRALERARADRQRLTSILAREEAIDPHGGSARDRQERKLASLQRRCESLEEAVRRTAFKREIYFAGLEVTPDEVHYAAVGGLLLSFVALVGTLVALVVLSQGVVSPFLLVVALLAFVLPISLYLFVYNYPGMLARRLRVQTLGRAPEAVHYMAMSLRLNRSLPRAVRFASENVEGNLGAALKKVQWDVMSRKHPSLEESFLHFADEWGNWNEDFMRSMYALRLSTHEKTDEGLTRNLEKAQDIVLSGTRRKIEEFASSLSGPTTVFFALGVLLPLVIGAMLPMVFLSNLANVGNLGAGPGAGAGTAGAPSTTGSAGTSANSTNSIVTVVGFVLAMDVGFPFVALLYSMQILSKRPGTVTPPRPPEQGVRRPSRGESALLAAATGGLAGALALPAYLGYFGPPGTLAWPVFVLLGLGAGISMGVHVRTRALAKRGNALQKLENEFPDTLFQLASRMGEGLRFERAVERTSAGMRGTESSQFFDRTLHVLRVSGGTPEQALFGSARGPGLLTRYPSRQMRVSLRALLEAASKGPQAVTDTVIPMAQHLKELRNTDASIRTSLRGTVQMMKGSAFFFAPIVMGMTGALYLLLSGVLASGALAVPPPLFFAVMGVYLLEMVFIIGAFSIGIETGGDRLKFWTLVGQFLWLAVLVYAVGAFLGIVFLGGGAGS
ncbi:MAG: type II secretion system F family protein [Euryarchaeota archaeon]|nr:type II secretion system F family protein [Euryarchaeota archaeon]MDE1836903.1 type II secretion system F family protein [Euryarchaeota archaeon]MDE2045306.1 type II secretion system F family protein [Thermoplasmata archaeon]